MKPIHLTMDIPPPEIRGNSRAHWRKVAASKKVYKETAFYTLREAMITSDYKYTPVECVFVKYLVYWCGRQIDRDNFTIGMKSFLDALIPPRDDMAIDFALGLIPDDSPDHVDSSIDYVRVRHKTDEMYNKVAIVITQVETEAQA